ncbi:MAG: MotA/TolQ/ExbB proton channel family protein [Deltaproteobacteria bacterium]
MSLFELLSQGGWSMYPIYLCSVVALAVFVKKLLEIRAARLWDMGWLEAVVGALGRNQSEQLATALKSSPHPGTRVVAAMLSTLSRRPDRAEAEGRRVGSLELQQLEKNLALLSFIAQAAPLLGLLGTVLGMVDLFLGLQGTGMANVDVSTLSSGIWKALLTTAAGLLVAVPTLAGYSYLTSRTDHLRLQLANAIQRVLTEAPVEAA